MTKITHGHIERSWQQGLITGGDLRTIKEVTSVSNEYKVVITQGSDNRFRILVFRHFYDEAVDECYWSQSSTATFTDTIETAETLAREELHRISGGDII